MRRTLSILSAALLALSLLASAPSGAEGESSSQSGTSSESTESVTPDPVDVTLYFHGQGERYVDENSYLETPAEMDRTEPTGDDFDSKQLTNYAVGPNPNCAGNGLFPAWVGLLGEGTIVGDATVTFDVVGSTGGDATVNVWADVSSGQCNENYPTPDASVTVTLPAGTGTVEVPLPTDGLRPGFQLMVQIQPASEGPASFNPAGQARVLYDGADYPASISFTCQPDDVTTQEQAAEADCSPF